MSNSKPSINNRSFYLAAGFTVVLGVGLVMAVRPAAVRYAQNQAADLVRQAASQPADEANLSYRLAGWLDAHNQTAAAARAEQAIAQGDADRALRLLDTARGVGESAPMRIAYLKAYLETDQISAAVAEANELSQTSTDQATLAWAALVDGVGKRTTELTALAPRVTAPEAAKRVAAARAGNVPLARELASSGLYASTRALLVKAPSSYERSMMLGDLDVRANTSPSLTEAIDYYRSAIAINPASIEARQSLVKTLKALDRTADANHEQQLLNRLTSGQL